MDVEIPIENLRGWKRQSWQCVPKFLEEILKTVFMVIAIGRD